jgi:hypothetical protein
MHRNLSMNAHFSVHVGIRARIGGQGSGFGDQTSRLRSSSYAEASGSQKL